MKGNEGALMRMKMYATIYGNIYRETLWEVNMEYIPKDV